MDAGDIGLPTSEQAIASYLTNSYGGVGKKTADALVEAFGSDIFTVFENEPERVAEIVPRRAHQVLAEWKADLARRSERSGGDQDTGSGPDSDVSGAPQPAQEVAHEPRQEAPREQETTNANFGSSSEGTTDSKSSSTSAPAPRSGGARRRTRRSPRPPPSSGSDE